MAKPVNNGKIDAAAKTHAGADEKKNIISISGLMNYRNACSCSNEENILFTFVCPKCFVNFLFSSFNLFFSISNIFTRELKSEIS